MARKKKNKNKSAASAHANSFEEVLMSWHTLEFLRYKRGILWHLIFGLLDAALITYAVMTGSWTMTLVFALVPLIYLLETRRKPKVVEVIFSPYGIKFGDIKLAYSDIQKFWILHDPPYLNELHLKTNKRLHPELTIPLLNLDPSGIRAFMVTQVPEWEGKQESLLDVIVRVFKLA